MKKTVRISFEGKTYDVEVEVLEFTASAPSEIGKSSSGSYFLTIAKYIRTKLTIHITIIEALKMENPVVAPCAGTVNSISVKETDTVVDGQTLMTIA